MNIKIQAYQDAFELDLHRQNNDGVMSIKEVKEAVEDCIRTLDADWFRGVRDARKAGREDARTYYKEEIDRKNQLS